MELLPPVSLRDEVLGLVRLLLALVSFVVVVVVVVAVVGVIVASLSSNPSVFANAQLVQSRAYSLMTLIHFGKLSFFLSSK